MTMMNQSCQSLIAIQAECCAFALWLNTRVRTIRFLFLWLLFKHGCQLEEEATCLNTEEILPLNLTSPVQRLDCHRSLFTRYISFPGRC